MEDLGFIILRHVNNEQTNNYWLKSYSCIRKFYPETTIVIIDDNSDFNFITNEALYKTIIILSSFPKRGELLPYYYYLKYAFFKKAVIIHDSVFINKYFDFSTVENYKFLWEFDSKITEKDELNMISVFNDPALLDFYHNKDLWKGCFGAMIIITYDYLKFVDSKHDISKLLDLVVSRETRCAFERIIACLLQFYKPKECLLGDILTYCRWGIKFNQYDNYTHLPIIKVWTGR